MSTARVQLEIREQERRDEGAILALLQASLGWVPDEMFAAFFDWKHRQSPFGQSPAWVAVDGDRVVGFRTYMRWEFNSHRGIHRAVRAVDTATHPDYQGRGIFSRLTRASLETLRDDGVEFVFNTPNDQSRPGYLKMGWRVVGRVPISIRLRSPTNVARVMRARVAADKWSTASTAGIRAREVLHDHACVDRLLSTQPERAGLSTRRTAAFLEWRYGFDPLRYRILFAGSRIEEGLIVFRLRRRGPALEVVVADVLVPGGDVRLGDRLAVQALHESGADYVLRVGRAQGTNGFVPLPGQGPILTLREVSDDEQPQLRDWLLTLGDVELF